MFIGVSGSPFPVFGGDDMLGYIQDVSGTWRLKNFGKAFVSPYANLDLASTFEMQSQELGTVFELDGSAWLVDEDGVSYPLYRKDGLWQFQIRFPPNDGATHDTAYQAACDSENISAYVGDCPYNASAQNFDIPGAFCIQSMRQVVLSAITQRFPVSYSVL